MFQTLSQYIASLRRADAEGYKERKIAELLAYYDEYTRTSRADAQPGVIYARYSDISQREESIEDQVSDCLKYAGAEKILVLGVYIDKAISGRTDDRASFREMIQDAPRGNWKFVITWKIDRFARNRYDSATYKTRLKKAGVQVRYAKEHIPDGPEGIILESVLEGFAEYYSANLSENVKRGCHGNALEAKSNGARVALGLKLDEGRHYIIDPDTAPIVEKIFSMYDKGHSPTEIADHLNGKGLKTSTGRAFSTNSISFILRNHAYIGTYRYADVTIDNAFPALIDKELWEAVQTKLGRKSRLNGKKKDSADYILTTKIFCASCGSGFIGESGRSRTGDIHYYYKCMDRKRGRRGSGCKMRALKKDWIEDLVISEARRLLDSEESRAFLVEVIMRAQDRDADTSHLDALKAELIDVERSIQNLMRAIEQGILTPGTKERMFSLEEQKARLKTSIMEESQQRPMMTPGDVDRILKMYCDRIDASPEYRQDLVDMLINAVYVYQDKIIIAFNFTDGPSDRVKLHEIEKALENDAYEAEEAECEKVRMLSSKACQEVRFANFLGRSPFKERASFLCFLADFLGRSLFF